jgi:hypothetical protein
VRHDDHWNQVSSQVGSLKNKQTGEAKAYKLIGRLSPRNHMVYHTGDERIRRGQARGCPEHAGAKTKTTMRLVNR